MSPLREAAIEAIRSLPENGKFDELLEDILYYANIEEGLRDADAGRLIPIEEVMAENGVKV